jgi:hypothetical protein
MDAPVAIQITLCRMRQLAGQAVILGLPASAYEALAESAIRNLRRSGHLVSDAEELLIRDSASAPWDRRS